MNKTKMLGTLLISGVLLGACTAKEADTNKESKEVESQLESVVVSEETTEKTLKDGTYELNEQAFSETGWKESLKIVVTNGEITDATWTSVNEAGLNKLVDSEYQEKMAGITGVGPQDFIPALEAALLETQSPADIDVVTGATGTAEKFKDYAQQLLDAAATGQTSLILVDNGVSNTSEILIDDAATTESE